MTERIDRTDLTETELLPYRIGGLLYTPATNTTIVPKLQENAIPGLTSIVFCLEDAIGDAQLPAAERNLKQSLQTMEQTAAPLLFVRVRTPEHLAHLGEFLAEELDRLTGFVLPKFDESNLQGYFTALEGINRQTENPKYIMPILESRAIARSSRRVQVLETLRHSMAAVKDRILNVRVGGNDFSNIYGLRRNVHQNIYQMGVVRDILVDILNVFADEYVVSGPVWEFYDNGTNDLWKTGLIRELELDRLNGFIGKTAIHPSQLPLICESLMPTESDFQDAMSILNWSSSSGVMSGAAGNRMNEVKTHQKWAERTYKLGVLYGTKAEDPAPDEET